MNETKIKNLLRLQDISKFGDDWNGYGANSFDKNLIDSVENIIENVHVQPGIYPTGCNSIQLEYELEDESYLEFEVFKDKILCMRIPQRNYNKSEHEVIQPTDIKRINEIIDNFYIENEKVIDMELKDTIEMMNSEDYKERFKAEYYQTKIRYDKLHQMLIKHEAGTLDFKPACPIHVLATQKRYMREYLRQLEIRAEIEGIKL